jgi:hypothetical protein
MCKSLVSTFPLVGLYTIWNIGNGQKVRIEKDPWMGAKEELHIFEVILCALHEVGILSLEDTQFQPLQVCGRLDWNSCMKIGLEGSLVVKWNSYVGKLVSNFF